MTSLVAVETGPEPLEVVIAGGGVAALEALLALHELAGPRAHVTLVAPNREFVDRPMSVAAPFGLAEPRRWDLGEIVRAQGAAHVVDAVTAVDDASGVATTAGGLEVPYDALLLATGVRRMPALEGALSFGGPDDVDALAGLVRAAEAGDVESIAFAVPQGVAWTLPLYELALMTAAHLAARGAGGVELSLATGERAPLGVFGRRTADMVAELLHDAGVSLRLSAPKRAAHGALILDDRSELRAAAVVAMPRLEAPAIKGVPAAARGFIPTDAHCKVEGLDTVYAAGDATWFPIKQGGIAAQQADAAASSIAALAGAPVTPRRFRPVLRGALLTGNGVHYLRHSRATKVAARRLTTYLEGDPAPASGEEGALAMAFDAADADAEWGDYGAALRWLGVAERLALVLPPEYAEKRERWRDAQAGIAVRAIAS